MTTKEKILDASRRLLNMKGLANVSVRDICGELGISLGNLTYHFPNKDIIIVKLYEAMKKEISDVYAALPRDKVSVTTYLDSHQQVFQIQSRYKFILLNLFELITHYPEIKASYLDNAVAERQAAKEMLRVSVSMGILKKDISNMEFEHMLNVGQILNNAWIMDAELFFSGSKKQQLKYYMGICCGLLEPYLKQASAKEYRRYFEKL